MSVLSYLLHTLSVQVPTEEFPLVGLQIVYEKKK